MINKYPFFSKYMMTQNAFWKEVKLVFIDDRFTLPYIIFKGKDCINEFIRWVLDKQKWTQQITKKYFNKRLIMTNGDEEIYKNSQIYWIYKGELNTDKVRSLPCYW